MQLNQLLGIVLLSIFLFSISACKKDRDADVMLEGAAVSLGDGDMWTYVRTNSDDEPIEIGIRFTESMLTNLPTTHSDMSHCYDTDGNGTFGEGECYKSHERLLMLPDELTADIPFKWVLINWNPIGHMPDGVYNVPHFDMHFYIQSLEGRNDIKTGPCLNLMNCDDLATALRPIPARYMAPGYVYPPDGTTVEPAMGGHIVNTNSPELCCMEPFTHTFIYGGYDGHVTFYEPMMTLDLLKAKEAVNIDISLPEAWEEAGYYPTRYEINYNADEGFHSVSLHDFVYRTAG